MVSSLPFEVFLALRHLGSRHRRRIARATTLIAIVGIATGVGALIVALSLANGFQNELRAKILGGTAHITLMRSDGQPMHDHAEVAKRVRAVEGVVAAAGTSYGGAILIGPNSSGYAVMRGVDLHSKFALNDIEDSIIEGSGASLFESSGDLKGVPGVIIGAELAARTGLKVGERADIILADIAQARSLNKRFVRVVGIFRSGLYEYDSAWIYVSLDGLALLHGGTPSGGVISVQVADIDRVKDISAKIHEVLGAGYTIVDWQEANRPLFAALAVERRIGFIIISLIVLIAALNITNTLILMVFERRSDIAILHAMGASRRSIMGIFVIEGALIGIGGAVTGIALGVISVLVANRYKLVNLPADVYSISEVPLRLQPSDVLLAAAVAFALSSIATIYPALAAARIRPAALLREA